LQTFVTEGGEYYGQTKVILSDIGCQHSKMIPYVIAVPWMQSTSHPAYEISIWWSII